MPPDAPASEESPSGSLGVLEPILNSPFKKPKEHWLLNVGEEPKKLADRRPSLAYPPQTSDLTWTLGSTLAPSVTYRPAMEMMLVNLIRRRVEEWREQGYPGVTRTTLELLQWWTREGRKQPLFFAQVEAAETILFLSEARADLRQGIDVPLDEPSEEQKSQGFSGFLRRACKMATGTGKTTVMGMLIAWSVLNKVADRSDKRFSDAVLVVCPNVTIRDRLAELNPELGERSVYRTRDLVPSQLMPALAQGRVLITNWHVFEPQTAKVGKDAAKVVKAGVRVRTKESITIGQITTTQRGQRYMTLDELERQIAAGFVRVLSEDRDRQGNLKKVQVEGERYVESDAAMVKRVLGVEVGNKVNILVLNDEAHHAYRIRRAEPEEGEEEEDEDIYKEATVWVEGLDRIHKLRGINLCVDLSATPYFLGRMGSETWRPFPWIVSDFSLVDAIEAGLTKIPQLCVRDPTGADIPGYFNIWQWILRRLSSAEKGGKSASPKPEAVLKWANVPLNILSGMWDDLRKSWEAKHEQRPPVFILVCKNTKIAKVLYEWIAEGETPAGIPPNPIAALRNTNGRINTIRVDSKVIAETDVEGAKGDESRWMRFTLDTVGKLDWPRDGQGGALMPEGFEELATKLGRPAHPPGRDVRCIVSVGMLTEGWDCNTVTHIIGLRPFMSQLLCEQVVGRGLRRASYALGDDGKFSEEEATVFGVPFEIVPYKATAGSAKPPKERKHIHAVPEKARFEIRFPRLQGFQQKLANKITVDWDHVPGVIIDPMDVPPEVQLKAGLPSNQGRPLLSGPGKTSMADLSAFRRAQTLQQMTFELSRSLTREYIESGATQLPPHVLFPQLHRIVQRYVEEKVTVLPPNDKKDPFCSPYYGWVIESIKDAIRPVTTEGEAPELPIFEKHRGPGSTAEVSFWTSKDVREVERSHVNYVVADTKVWEQSAAYFIDTSKFVAAFVKNQGLGFAIPYTHNGEDHDYVPDFIIRLNTEDERYLVLETKGYDELSEVKAAAAERWVRAVTAAGNFGKWFYVMVRQPTAIPAILAGAAAGAATAAAVVAGGGGGRDDRFAPPPSQTVEDIIGLGESEMREFKATLQWDVRQSQINKELRQASLKTIAAFLNTRGGTLLIGVEDDGTVRGLDDDLRTVGNSLDKLGQTLASSINEAIGPVYAPYYRSTFEKTGDKRVCRVEVQRSAEAVFVKGPKGKEFYIRQGNTTRSLDVEEAHRYIKLHWAT